MCSEGRWRELDAFERVGIRFQVNTQARGKACDRRGGEEGPCKYMNEEDRHKGGKGLTKALAWARVRTPPVLPALPAAGAPAFMREVPKTRPCLVTAGAGFSANAVGC